jgi:branched-chain amino acid transport system permease protein
VDSQLFFVQLLNGVQYGLLLFLVSSGLTLIFGAMGIINLAHGSFYMLGAYLAFSLSVGLGNFWLALAVGLVLSMLVGLMLEWLLFSRLYHIDHLHQVLLSYGLILVFEEMRSILWGDEVHGVKPPDILSASIPLTESLSYPVYRLWISAACLALTAGMFWFLHKTRIGMMIRAGSSNREMVEALGLDIRFVYRIVFALGVGMAAIAGMLSAPVSSVYPGMGNDVLIICFVVVVIGGIGSIKGAMAAAMLIGVLDTFGKTISVRFMGFELLPELAGATMYLLMAAILLLRPKGLFGKTDQ